MLFSRNPRKADQLEAQIRELLQNVQLDRIPGADAAAYNAAGDLYAEAGLVDRALSYYGLSIDAFLKVERWDAAAAVCRKVLRLSPATVRARCTLAWLAIGKEMPREAEVHIRDYVAAAVKAGHDALAVAQLKRMGDAAGNAGLRQVVGEYLLNLGADRAADHVFGTVYKERNSTRRATVPDDLLWSTVRRAALLGPRDLGATR